MDIKSERKRGNENDLKILNVGRWWILIIKIEDVGCGLGGGDNMFGC